MDVVPRLTTITKAQITQIMGATINAKDDAKINSRNYFLFMFYCRGLNFTDLAGLNGKIMLMVNYIIPVLRRLFG